MRPAVSVITATWQRHDLLLDRCLPAVAEQLYAGHVEHLVVSDGPDPELERRLARRPRLRLEQLPEHSEVKHWGVLPRRRGLELAQGELIAYLDDDNAWRRQHLELLVHALCQSGADFAYSRMLVRPEQGAIEPYVLGLEPPQLGQIDCSLLLHRRQLLELGSWEVAGYAADWDLVDRWLEAGASYVHVPRVTMDYYLTP